MKLKLMLLLIISPILSFSQCISGDCENGNGVYIQKDKTRIEGQWKNRELSGQCSIFFSDGDSFVGEMVQGKKNGKGLYKKANGYSEEGIYKNDTLSGYVTVKYTSGNIYVGNWANNHQNGNGKYTQIDGYSEEGKFVNDTLVGFATLIFPSGNKYLGYVNNSQPEGKGIYHYDSGDKFDGQFKDGLRHGAGILYYAKGGTLKGEWSNNEFISGSNKTYNSKNVITPNLTNGGVYEVNANINNVLKLDMIFDTGASEILFSRDVYNTLVKTKTISNDDLLEGGQYMDANGNVNYNVRFILRKLQIGNYTLDNIPCCVAKDELGANLLGLSAIKKLGKFTFDFEKGIIEIK
jgi:clan AA aspartic protease (TIGR02281 family)